MTDTTGWRVSAVVSAARGAFCKISEIGGSKRPQLLLAAPRNAALRYYFKTRRRSLAGPHPDSLPFLLAGLDCLPPVRHTSQIIREIPPSRRRNNLRICCRKTPEFNMRPLSSRLW